ncbi:FAD/NAD(P)-binding protein [Pararobbsia silviterrae]|uniref:FAD-dependent urate hydroxylase HpyO/Asp monooxygenase CreE-like FAD/NAD(P)-binding domain-containing protein n=1 Tax=Pararobbsia silviterrae TaxID=1792498 RepID=A0A494YDQ8_9BURK|nr:FAD/NAD(P)-binding protein [Pararobbsia silviterrae]RKP58473.1 hypothetical protein D7S86_00465 [Pararobbsia silviterrae]
MKRTVLIIGGGFTGTALAVNVLRMAAPEGVRVVMINRSGQMARGVAYGTHDNQHLLNVPAGNMSLLADDPQSFVEFCRAADPAVTPKTFVARQIYGSYLEHCLSDAEMRHASRGELIRLVGEVVRIGSLRTDDGRESAVVRLRDGDTVHADHVVLACGHFAPANPRLDDASVYADTRYIRDPWQPGALARVPAHENVLLIGTGLTAVDVALHLAADNPARRCHAVSRRGLMPQGHRTGHETPTPFDASELVLRMGSHVRGYVRALREEIEARQAEGFDWRDIVAALRPHTAALWQRLALAERRRFLRHLQPYWDVHRHRTAPDSHRMFHDWVSAGHLRIHAGHLVRLEARGDAIAVELRQRGTSSVTSFEVGYVINCTGPSSQVTGVADPLIQALLADGTMQVDAARTGIDVDDAYRLVGADGRLSSVLRYAGPLLRARDWEATAVPELRMHAARLAQMLVTAPERASVSTV